MDELRPQAVAARVVAWHNRHPLARPIDASAVHGVGYVVLPYRWEGTAPEAAALATEASAAAACVSASEPKAGRTAPRSRLQALFSEDFLPPLSPRRIARWAPQHAQQHPLPATAAPLREVVADIAVADGSAVPLYLLSAAIAVGSSRRRVLIGAGDVAHVLGRRIWSLPRIAALGLLLGGVATAALQFDFDAATPSMAAVAAGAAVASTAPAASAAPTPAAPQVPALAAPAAMAASAAARHAVSPGATASQAIAVAEVERAIGTTADVPTAVAAAAALEQGTKQPLASAVKPAAERIGAATQPRTPALRLVRKPRVVTPLSADEKAAARSWRDARAASASTAAAVVSSAAPGAPTPLAATAATTAAAADANPPSQTSAVDPESLIYAVTTRKLRTRAEADQFAEAMSALLQARSGSPLRVDVMAQGDDWRVVGWPYPERDAAEKMRALLTSRGMRVQVVSF